MVKTYKIEPGGTIIIPETVEDTLDSGGNTDTGYTRGKFKTSDAYNAAYGNVTSAKKALTDLGNAKWYYGTDADGNKILGDYVLNGYLSDYQNRKKFSYDFNTDALYQQYKDKYIKQAKMASADVMGQAAAMTGGYGSSYAQTVGNQAYQASLEQLNDVIPELYQLAYDKYNQEGQDLLNTISLLRGERENYYNRYNEDYSRAAGELEYWTNQANALWERDFAQYTTDEDYKYNTYRDSVEDNLNERRLAMQEEAWKYEQQALGYVDPYGIAYSGTMSNGNKYNNGSLDSEAIKKLQKAYGIPANGYWDETSSEKAGGLTAEEAYAEKYGTPHNYEPPQYDTSIPLADMVSEAWKIKDKAMQADYLAQFINAGRITGDEAQKILNGENIIGLTDRTWDATYNGGLNWWGGVDGNAIVKDQYGNKYTLEELKAELEKEDMSSKEAKQYIKELQKELGI